MQVRCLCILRCQSCACLWCLHWFFILHSRAQHGPNMNICWVYYGCTGRQFLEGCISLPVNNHCVWVYEYSQHWLSDKQQQTRRGGSTSGIFMRTLNVLSGCSRLARTRGVCWSDALCLFLPPVLLFLGGRERTAISRLVFVVGKHKHWTLPIFPTCLTSLNWQWL